jgi:hypothetical protein
LTGRIAVMSDLSSCFHVSRLFTATIYWRPSVDYPYPE